MRRMILKAAALSIALGALGLVSSPNAQADQALTAATARHKPTAEQNQRARQLPQTVVIRVDKTTGKIEVAHHRERLAPRPLDGRMLESSLVFSPVDSSQTRLSGQALGASWIFSFLDGLWNYPTYTYYDYDYTYEPYYSYGYGNYDYSYYGWPYSYAY